MHFRSQVTIRKANGSILPPIVLLHEDDDILSGLLFLQSIGRQMGWHRNGELCALELQVGPTPEHISGSNHPVPAFVPSLVASSPEADLCAAFPSFASTSSCPNGALRS